MVNFFSDSTFDEVNQELLRAVHLDKGYTHPHSIDRPQKLLLNLYEELSEVAKAIEEPQPGHTLNIELIQVATRCLVWYQFNRERENG